MQIDPRSLAQYIDHTVLRLDADAAQIDKAIDEALEFSFKSICIRREWLTHAKSRLRGSQVLLVTVVGFPSGEETTEQKVAELTAALELGADEVDFVLNRSFLKSRAYDRLWGEMSALRSVAGRTPLKVILETSELTQEEKIIACAVAASAGIDFVKTSTGFSKGGATADDVMLMRSAVGTQRGVKASGGIRTYSDALRMIQAGANRLGCSASVDIVQQSASSGDGY